MFPSNLMKKTNFPNMAGRGDCDKWIEKELIEAEIPIRSGYKNWSLKEGTKQSNGIMIINNLDDYIHKYRCHNEVPYHIIGKIGDFIFERAWYYWIVDGNVPLKMAEELYEDPIGKDDVRVVGHCGCPPPEKWCTEIEGKKYITSYHIDSQEGLNLFVKSIKKIIIPKDK